MFSVTVKNSDINLVSGCVESLRVLGPLEPGYFNCWCECKLSKKSLFTERAVEFGEERPQAPIQINCADSTDLEWFAKETSLPYRVVNFASGPLLYLTTGYWLCCVHTTRRYRALETCQSTDFRNVFSFCYCFTQILRKTCQYSKSALGIIPRTNFSTSWCPKCFKTVVQCVCSVTTLGLCKKNSMEAWATWECSQAEVIYIND